MNPARQLAWCRWTKCPQAAAFGVLRSTRLAEGRTHMTSSICVVEDSGKSPKFADRAHGLAGGTWAEGPRKRGDAG